MNEPRNTVQVPAPEDDYPGVLERSLRALEERGREAAEVELAEIAWKRTTIAARPGLSRLLQGRVFRRDHFHCRYCGASVIPIPIMELLGDVFGERFPYHPNWKGGQTHPAVLSRTAIIDHVAPVAGGGSAFDEANLVTACWPCNAKKADLSLARLGWELLPISDDDWDGLTRFYRRLWNEAGRPKERLHRDWARGLGVGVD
jgi:5-methylcytosine-specific restriction endonuclease McrA